MIQPKMHCQILSSVNYGLIILHDGLLKVVKEKGEWKEEGIEEMRAS